MRWPCSVTADGGCTDPRWVASFTKVSFVHPTATGDLQKKSLSNSAVSLESLLTAETRDLTCTDSYLSETNTQSRLNYFIIAWASKLCIIYVINKSKPSAHYMPSKEHKKRLWHRKTLGRLYCHFLSKQSILGNMQQTHGHTFTQEMHLLCEDNRGWAGRVYCHRRGQDNTGGLTPFKKTHRCQSNTDQ